MKIIRLTVARRLQREADYTFKTVSVYAPEAK
jgi:hypothetical protein